MITVEFAPSLRRHIECPPQQVPVGDLRTVLAAALAAAPALVNYIFDDQGSVRKHVAVFVNQTMLRDRTDLSQTLSSSDHVLVIQALTGG
jgi:hypothetical protein